MISFVCILNGYCQKDTNQIYKAVFQNMIFICGDTSYQLYKIPAFISISDISPMFGSGWLKDSKDINCSLINSRKKPIHYECLLIDSVDTMYNMFPKRINPFKIFEHKIKDKECIENELELDARHSYMLSCLGYTSLEENNLYYIATFVPYEESIYSGVRAASIVIEIKNRSQAR
mgnify:CR=1 FL=1